MLARVPSPLRRIRLLAALLTATMLLVACTSGPNGPGPSPSPEQSPDATARALAVALGTGDLSSISFAGADGAQAASAYIEVVEGMGDRTPTVALGSLTEAGDTATASLDYRWPIANGLEWSYRAEAVITKVDDRWVPQWSPSLVNPELQAGELLSLRRQQAERGALLDPDRRPIMTLRDVRRYGIEKGPAKSKAEDSAAKLARLVGIDTRTYVAKVKAAGELAFVEAITYRADDPDRPSLNEVDEIAGATVLGGQAVLGPNRQFARALIGTVGEATQEIVEKSDGAVVAGDQTGLSGLQLRYDEKLRGQPQITVVALPARTAPSASPGSSARPSASSSSATVAEPRTIWNREAKDGSPVTITLDTGLQSEAERLLAKVKPASAIVAIKPSTGEIVVAANGPGSSGQALATTGRYAPGSTFKVVTVLALLRAGLAPQTKVDCPTKITVDGRMFENYDDYPAGKIGKITLTEAVANSCNTAFIGLRKKISTADLREAAESLGVGRDYDVGFSSYFGEVPDDKTATGQAAAMIGQGKVTVSPLAMAQVAASVGFGKTVVGQLVQGTSASPAGSTLTADEAEQLQAMMSAVVSQGSGRALTSLADGAKTGTAEYGQAKPPRTHAWMIAYGDDLAVAVFVADGSSGSGTAGPILKAFLQRA